MAQHFLDTLSPAAISRLSAEDIARMEQREAITEQARQMKPVEGGDSRVFTTPKTGAKFPSMRYHARTGEQTIIKSEAEDKALGPEWSKIPPKVQPVQTHAQVQSNGNQPGMSMGDVSELADRVEILEGQLELLAQRLDALESSKKKGSSKKK